jgi:bifunctional UDP-N-acetylglucosamine pyrophosphorylase/glucosamine-1-phosphate N-acetyltransferase
MILDDPEKYGRIVRDSDGNPSEIIEYKDASEEIRAIKEVNSGIYCFDSESLFKALEKIDNKNKQGEYYLTDVIKILYDENQRVNSVVLEDIAQSTGVNSIVQLSELEQNHYHSIRTHWMERGVYIENPETVLIEEDVVIENDVYISANTIIMGESRIEKNSYIGPHSMVIDSHLKEGSYLAGMNVVNGLKNEVIKLKYQQVIVR